MTRKSEKSEQNNPLTENEIIFPIRINRYLYLKNYCSRRQADILIEKGLIKINGNTAIIGQKVEQGDLVTVANSVKNLDKKYQYYIFNKPLGVVSHNPQRGEKSVTDFFPPNLKLAPIGRLDKNSTGLMLLTDDGRITDKMLNPKYFHEKEYEVRVEKDLKESFKRKMEKGVNIEGYKTKPAKVKITGPKTFKIILTEGKKHQIRRMCANLGYTVISLKRIRILNLKATGLKPGEKRKITQQEISELFSKIGLPH